VRATGSSVNIVDSVDATRIAHVTAGGALQVGGSVTATPASPATFLQSAAFGLNSGVACTVIATPPSGKAMIVKRVLLDVFNDPSPGSGQRVDIFKGTNCNTVVADVNPPTVGATVIPFDPGLGIPAGSGLSVNIAGSVQAETYTTGYWVGASAVPASSEATGSEGSQNQRPASNP
jgi:hypothetical protein